MIWKSCDTCYHEALFSVLQGLVWKMHLSDCGRDQTWLCFSPPCVLHKCFSHLHPLECSWSCVESGSSHRRPERTDCSVFPRQDACFWNRRDGLSERSIQVTASWDTNNKSNEMLIDVKGPRCYNCFLFKEGFHRPLLASSVIRNDFPKPELKNTVKEVSFPFINHKWFFSSWIIQQFSFKWRDLLNMADISWMCYPNIGAPQAEVEEKICLFNRSHSLISIDSDAFVV